MFRYNKINNEKGRHKLISILLIMVSIIIFKFISGILFMTFVPDEENEILLIIYGLYSNVFVITIVMAMNCFYNKKTLKNIGLGYRGWSGFLKGILFGILLIVLILVPILLMSRTNIEMCRYFNLEWIFVLLGGFLIQSASEEILFRGYIQNILSINNNGIFAISIQALIFASVHILNAGCSILAVLNLLLFATILGFIQIIVYNIYFVCGIHFIWNTVLAFIIDGKISGILLPISISRFNITGNKFIVGGNFGIEESLITTVVFSCAFVIFFNQLKNIKWEIANGNANDEK